MYLRPRYNGSITSVTFVDITLQLRVTNEYQQEDSNVDTYIRNGMENVLYHRDAVTQTEQHVLSGVKKCIPVRRGKPC